MSDEHQGDASGTVASDYGSCYYNDAHLGGYDTYTWENEQWRTFFRMVADRIVALTRGGRVLDVGCAKGLLVQALRERGADARGLDLSQHAIDAAHPDVREFLWAASASDPIDGRYDLVCMIEMIEHMSPADAQLAIDHVTAVTDRVLFSSSPGDHDEATHVNTRPTAAWVAWFAERGFYRRTDVDLTFLSPWAVLFERADRTVRDVVQAYESHLVVLTTELLEKRAALLGAHRTISEMRESQQEGDLRTSRDELSQQVRELESEVLAARQAALVSRDHVVGIEAEVGRQNADILRMHAQLRKEHLRAERLETRKRAQAKRVKELQAKLRVARQRNAALTRRLAEAPAPRPSLARRVARRLRGSVR